MVLVRLDLEKDLKEYHKLLVDASKGQASNFEKDYNKLKESIIKHYAGSVAANREAGLLESFFHFLKELEENQTTYSDFEGVIDHYILKMQAVVQEDESSDSHVKNCVKDMKHVVDVLKSNYDYELTYFFMLNSHGGSKPTELFFTQTGLNLLENYKTCKNHAFQDRVREILAKIWAIILVNDVQKKIPDRHDVFDGKFRAEVRKNLDQQKAIGRRDFQNLMYSAILKLSTRLKEIAGKIIHDNLRGKIEYYYEVMVEYANEENVDFSHHDIMNIFFDQGEQPGQVIKYKIELCNNLILKLEAHKVNKHVA